MKLSQKAILSAILVLLPIAGTSQNYDKYASQIRADVWAWDKPEFKNYNVPDEYKDESAVILAQHQYIEAMDKGKNGFAYMDIAVNHEFYYTFIDRQLVKINDKVSLEKYSKLSFKEEARTSGFRRANKFRTVVGVRIIKSDGTMKNIDVDAETVSVTEGKEEKETYQKLAISDLQVGDIIDYFICEYAELETENIPPKVFLFHSSYPVLSYSIHAELSQYLTVEYQCLNDAPDFTCTKAKNGKDYALDVVQKNLSKVESGQWSSLFRDLPIIRLNILNNTTKQIYKTKSARGKGLYKRGSNLSRQNILDEGINTFDRVTDYDYRDLRRDIIKIIEKDKRNNSNLTEKEISQKMFDLLFLKWNLKYIHSSYSFMAVYALMLETVKIPYQGILVANKYGVRLEDILSANDMECIIYVAGSYYSFPYNYRVSSEISSNYQGQDGYIFRNISFQRREVVNKVQDNKEVKIEESAIEDNKDIMKATIYFLSSDPLELVIERTNLLSGSMKGKYQNQLSSYELWDETMREYLNISESLIDDLKKGKSGHEYEENIETFFEKRREAQIDNVKAEIYDFHKIKAKEIISYTLLNTGYTSVDPNMQFEVKYSIDGLVKKAGDNLILDAGKLIGQQWVPDDKDRRRTVNAYLPTARIYENEINVQIPAGYNVQGIDNLTKSVDNEYASFSSSASVSGNILSIKARKVYKKSFIPVAEWNKLLAMLDKTNEFYAQSVILKKK